MSRSREQTVRTYVSSIESRASIESSMNHLLNDGYLVSSMTSNGPLILVVFEREIES